MSRLSTALQFPDAAATLSALNAASAPPARPSANCMELTVSCTSCRLHRSRARSASLLRNAPTAIGRTP
eukprot:6046951-Pyramimonas_sp.AAC.1